MIVTGAMTMLAALGAQVPAANATVLQPSGKWQVEFADSMCVMSRNCGTGRHAVQIGFRPFPTQPQMEIVMVTPDGHESTDENTGQGAVALEPAIDTGTPQFQAFDISHGRHIAHLHARRQLLEELARTQTLAIDADGRSVAVAVDKPVAALEAVHRCESDLLRHWNVDPTLFANVAQPAEPKTAPASWFDGEDYPKEALNGDVTGRSAALIAIDATGSITSCRVVETAGYKSLDTRTCAVLRQRGRYSPALDKDGKPIATWLVLPVRWKLGSNGF